MQAVVGWQASQQTPVGASHTIRKCEGRGFPVSMQEMHPAWMQLRYRCLLARPAPVVYEIASRPRLFPYRGCEACRQFGRTRFLDLCDTRSCLDEPCDCSKVFRRRFAVNDFGMLRKGLVLEVFFTAIPDPITQLLISRFKVRVLEGALKTLVFKSFSKTEK